MKIREKFIILFVILAVMASCSYNLKVYRECKDFGHSNDYCFRIISR